MKNKEHLYIALMGTAVTALGWYLCLGNWSMEATAALQALTVLCLIITGIGYVGFIEANLGIAKAISNWIDK
jgi:hypothetical protein